MPKPCNRPGDQRISRQAVNGTHGVGGDCVICVKENLGDPDLDVLQIVEGMAHHREDERAVRGHTFGVGVLIPKKSLFFSQDIRKNTRFGAFYALERLPCHKKNLHIGNTGRIRGPLGITRNIKRTMKNYLLFCKL